MARTNRVKSDGDAHYHVMSRTNGKRFLFEERGVKDELVDALRRAAEFSGVRLKAFAAMDNHFHAVVKVEKPDAPVGEEELLRRVGVLKGEKEKNAVAARWRSLAEAGDEAALAAEQDRYRARMHDVSEFVKTFKETFDRAFKRRREYCGSIWSGRFASTLVEDGEYLARCIRYVIHNPVRAGIVSQAQDYPWCWREEGCLETGTDPATAHRSEGERHEPGTDPMSEHRDANECLEDREGTVPEDEENRSVDGDGGSAGVRAILPLGATKIVACSVSPEWWLRRVVQIGAGKVFGSAGFVQRTVIALGNRFRAKSVAARAVGEIGFATHGWRLAEKAA